MKHVRLTIDAGGREAEVHPVFEVLASAPYLERTIGLHWNFSGDRLGLMAYVEGDVGAFRDALERIPEVLDHEVTPLDEDACYAYVQDETNPVSRQLFGTFTRGSLLIVPPVEYGGDGTVTFSVFGPTGEVQDAIDGVPDPVDVEVHEVTGMVGSPTGVEGRLSDRQREAVEAALDVGYYDIPRTGSQVDVAGAMGCAPSTAAEHLRKAEAKVLRTTLGGE
ncbi:MAG TPA: helix-turn-helix domain-containing protein [Halobacteriales archaeon]|nr:helix-turn-helix domain-containing protein [Halobacteriales archaeon]